MSIETAERVLRPSEAECLEAWRVLVEGEKAQVESLPDRPRPEDFYAPIAERFRDDPRRTDDPALDLVMAHVREEETWIDVGAGAGRFALPIALRARRVYAVEPSAGMRESFARSLAEEGLENIEVFDERWPSPSSVPVADVAFISHVGYDIADIGPFLDEMEAHAHRACIALMYGRTPLADFAPLWEPVHGSQRIVLPGMADFVTLLMARGSIPAIETISLPGRTFRDIDQMHEASRRPLWVLPGSEKDDLLRAALEQQAQEVESGYVLSTRPRVLGLVTWQPRSAQAS
jgi:hypothetical protein